MSRIKIKDLSKDVKISREEMKKVLGGNINFYTMIIPDSRTLIQSPAFDVSKIEGIGTEPFAPPYVPVGPVS